MKSSFGNGNNGPLRPAEYAEARLVEAILRGTFPIGSNLPAERELAAQIGVTRPTLREALQRLGRDGWLEIRQGKATRVRDYWHEGSLGVLGALVRYSRDLPQGFVTNLLEVRLALAPAYTALAVAGNAPAVMDMLAGMLALPDEPLAYAEADWGLHNRLTVLSGNPIFSLILNGFAHFYVEMAVTYFQSSHARASSRAYYQDLYDAVRQGDAGAAEMITRRVMEESIRLWGVRDDRGRQTADGALG